MNPLLSALLRVPVFLLGLFVTALPRPVELRLGRLLGRLGKLLDVKRRRIAEENIRRCLPELSAEQRAGLLTENFEHYGILVLELAHMFSPIPGHYRRYAEKNAVAEGLEAFERLNKRGKGTIAVTGHFANWELMGIGGLHGINCMVTGRRLKPDWLNDVVVGARAALNGRTASGRRILPELLRWIKEGNTSAFILDQYAAPPAGVLVRFFGVEVGTNGAVGLVAQRTGAPIFMVFQRRDERGIIHAVFEEAVLDDETLQDPLKCTQALAARVEAWIRANPAQWLWAHRRFKNVVWPEAPSGVPPTQKSRLA